MKFRSLQTLLLCLLWGSLLPGWSQGQTAKWATFPKYDALEPISPAMNKGRERFRTDEVLVGYVGDVLYPHLLSADLLTPFCNGRVLFLRTEADGAGTRYRLVGVLNGASLVLPPAGAIYYVRDYPFFSEGMLPVYIDQHDGALPYGFVTDAYRGSPYEHLVPKTKFQYGRVLPFITDRSMQFAWITRSGSGSRLQFAADWARDALQGNRKETVIAIDSLDRSIQKKYATFLLDPASVAERFDTLRDVDALLQQTWTPAVVDTIQTFVQNGLYGYRYTNGQVLLPPQFSDAKPFCRRGEEGFAYAIAAVDGVYGVLELIGRSSFSCEEKVDPAARQVVYNLHIPYPYSTEVLKIRILSSQGSEESWENKAGESVRTKVLPLSREDRTVEVRNDQDMLLYKHRFSGQAPVPAASEPFRATLSATTVRAGESDRAVVRVTVQNLSSGSLSGTLSASGNKVSVSQRSWSLQKGRKVTLTVSFDDIYEAQSRTLTVQAEGRSKTFTVQLVPFY